MWSFLHQQRGREGMGNGEQGRDAGARGAGGECGRTATATTRAIRKSKSTTRTIVHVVVASACWGERTRGIRMVRKELSSLFCRLVAVVSCRLRHVVWHTLQLVPYRCCFRVGEGRQSKGHKERKGGVTTSRIPMSEPRITTREDNAPFKGSWLLGP